MSLVDEWETKLERKEKEDRDIKETLNRILQTLERIDARLRENR